MKVTAEDKCMERVYKETKEDTIRIDDSICKEYVLPFILWKPNFLVKHLVIDNDNFAKLIDNMIQLKSIKIGSNSFTKHKNSYGKDDSRSFRVSNCDKLESIEIGQYSFSDYSGKFELSNTPSLKSLKIGIIGKTSSNFYFSSFSVQGNTLWNNAMIS